MADTLTEVQVIIHPYPVTAFNSVQVVSLTCQTFQVLPSSGIGSAHSEMI